MEPNCYNHLKNLLLHLFWSLVDPYHPNYQPLSSLLATRCIRLIPAATAPFSGGLLAFSGGLLAYSGGLLAFSGGLLAFSGRGDRVRVDLLILCVARRYNLTLSEMR